jgi:hypothetical protein
MSGEDQFRKTVSFANNARQSNYGQQNYGNTSGRLTSTTSNPNFSHSQSANTNSFQQRPSSSIGYNQIDQTNQYNVRPNTGKVTTTFNQGSSQVFNNPSTIYAQNYGQNNFRGMNSSMVVKPEQLIKIEIYSNEVNGSKNRHYSSRLASFIKSLNTLKARHEQRQGYDYENDNSFVNGGVWAKPFQNRNSITVVINGHHVVDSFPLTIFNEDPNWNFKNEMKTYRSKFIDTISQFSDCKFLANYNF